MSTKFKVFLKRGSEQKSNVVGWQVVPCVYSPFIITPRSTITTGNALTGLADSSRVGTVCVETSLQATSCLMTLPRVFLLTWSFAVHVSSSLWAVLLQRTQRSCRHLFSS